MLTLIMFETTASAISISCVESHFSFLRYDYVGCLDQETRTPPSEYTCPYVAMSLLLSFYDTYWNDKFVDEQYEWQEATYDSSKDKLVETFAPTTEAEDWEEYKNNNIPAGTATYPYYREYALVNANNFLEPYLISIGMDLEYHSPSDEYLGLTVDQTVAVLHEYLIASGRFNSNEIEIKCRKESDGYDVVSLMKNIIEDGFPVLYSGKTSQSESIDTFANGDATQKVGHQFIAYGIKDNGDVLLHQGAKGLEYAELSTTPFSKNKAIIWIEIKETLPHTHKLDYTDSITGAKVCSCQIYSSHPYHEDNHFYFDKYDTNNHYKECVCGLTKNVYQHSLTYSGQTYTFHYEICSTCEYKKYQPHNYTIPTTYTDQEHKLNCACGTESSTVEPHYEAYGVYYTRDMHYVYCECGYIFGTDFHDMEPGWKLGTSHCTICGYIRDNTEFGEAIMGIEDEAETSTE